MKCSSFTGDYYVAFPHILFPDWEEECDLTVVSQTNITIPRSAVIYGYERRAVEIRNKIICVTARALALVYTRMICERKSKLFFFSFYFSNFTKEFRPCRVY